MASTNTSSYITAGIAGGESFRKNLAAAASSTPDFTQISQNIVDARATKEKALINAKAKTDVAKIGADNLVEVTKIKNPIKKSRMAGKLAAFGAQALGGGLVGWQLKKGMNKEYDSSITDTALAAIEERLATQRGKLDDARSALDEVSNMSTTVDDPSSLPGYVDMSKYSGTGGTNSSTNTGKDGQPSSTNTGVSQTEGWRKLSTVLRTGEGTLGDKGYTTMFGGGQFTDTSRHPDKVIHSGRYSSAAAGAYQFMPATWAGVVKNTGVKDFSVESQEIGGRYLTSKRGVNPDAVFKTKAELGQALNKLSPEWASMPMTSGGSYYGQPSITLDQAWDIYQRS